MGRSKAFSDSLPLYCVRLANQFLSLLIT